MLFRLFCSFIFLVWSAYTFAGDWYASLGYTRSVGDALPDRPGFNVDNDTSDDGWQLNGGYQYSRNFALEFGVVDYGEQVYTLNVVPAVAFFNPGAFAPNLSNPFLFPAAGIAVVAPGPPPYAEITANTQGLRMMASGVLPLTENFSVSAQGGLFFSRYEMQTKSYSIAGFLFGSPTYAVTANEETSRDAEFFTGLGLQYDINSSVGVVLRWERILDLGDNATLEQDLDTYNLMFVYRL